MTVLRQRPGKEAVWSRRAIRARLASVEKDSVGSAQGVDPAVAIEVG